MFETTEDCLITNSNKVEDTVKMAELRAKIRDEELRKDQRKNHDFIQLKRPAMKYLRSLIKENSLAAQIFTFLSEYMDFRNAVVCSHSVLMEQFSVSRMSIYRALKYLENKGYLLIGKSGTTNVFTINPNIFWSSYATEKKYCEFQGTIFITESENKNLEIRAKKFKEILVKREEEEEPSGR